MPTAGAADSRMLCLGDSYTIGEGVAPSDCWPNQLQRLLAARGIALEPPQIIAQTGWSSEELITALDLAQPAADFAAVSLLIGVNDQYRNYPRARFEQAFTQLLSRAIGHARGAPQRVIVLSIPDWGVTPFASADARGALAIGAEIDTYNTLIQQHAGRAGCAFVDVTELSRRERSDWLVADQLHPSAAQYLQWAHAALACWTDQCVSQVSNTTKCK